MRKMEDKLFKTVFKSSPIGLVLVNKDTTLRDANSYMYKNFKIIPNDIKGQQFGNIFNCVAVFGSADICGHTEVCENCGLRNGVMAVLQDGIEIPETVMDHNFFIQGVEQKKWFKISASRVEMEDDQFAVVSFSDITTEKEYEALLNYQLTLDMATGVANKYTLLNSIRGLVSGVETMTVAIVDFDNFKSVNDRYGHLTGDRVLSIFCAVASENTRRQDILGRFGGEEFMLIFPKAYADLMIKVLKKIAQQFKLECEGELGFSPTFSAGIAEYNYKQISDLSVQDIVSHVDANLYEAKKRGKNMIVIDDVSFPL